MDDGESDSTVTPVLFGERGVAMIGEGTEDILDEEASIEF
jgi:hypothetical protein